MEKYARINSAKFVEKLLHILYLFGPLNEQGNNRKFKLNHFGRFEKNYFHHQHTFDERALRQ